MSWGPQDDARACVRVSGIGKPVKEIDMRARPKLAMVLAMCALGVFASTAGASAAEWHVAGSPLVGSSALAASSTGHFTMSSAGQEIKCFGVEVKGGKITAPAAGSIEHLVLHECTIFEQGGNCSLASKTIESKPLTIQAALGTKSPEDTVTLKPPSGTTFLEFTFEGG
ncbi:MAG: hypothetical protein ACRDJ3_01915, partial [Solirubrobacteraceae bacterium]